MILHWWQLGFGAGFSWLSGFFFGWAARASSNYQRGRADLAREIEEATGWHDPVCTCVNGEGKCHYHGDSFKATRSN